MKYFNIAEEMMHYPYVFYETEKKTMYIYCPNCGSVDEIQITSSMTIEEIKDNYRPKCGCFEASKPTYKRTCYRHKNLEVRKDFAEFSKLEDGSVRLNVYLITASFDSSNYYDLYAFRRHPVLSYKLVTTIDFLPNLKVEYRTRYYLPVCCRNVHIGDWRDVKYWSYRRFEFSLIEESFCELKGTYLEKYIPYLQDFYNTTNINADYGMFDEIECAFLALLHTKPYIQKVWKAGYIKIVKGIIGKFISKGINPYYTSDYKDCHAPTCSYKLNSKGKTLEKILRVNVDILDNFFVRDDCSLNDLENAHNFIKKAGEYKISLSKENFDIFVVGGSSLIRVLDSIQIDYKKTFKYMRNQQKKQSHFVIDYKDYLSDLIAMNINLESELLYPSNFKATHDRYSGLRRIFELKTRATKSNKDFKKMVEKMEQFCYNDESFKIYPIKSPTALIKEAGEMKNCSAGYIEKVARGECMIFLIRKIDHPLKPFCMLELRLDNGLPVGIVQNRAISNGTPPEDCRQFAEKWLNNVVLVA